MATPCVGTRVVERHLLYLAIPTNSGRAILSSHATRCGVGPGTSSDLATDARGVMALPPRGCAIAHQGAENTIGPFANRSAASVPRPNWAKSGLLPHPRRVR